MRWIVGGKAIERQAASTSQMGRFETQLLASNENFFALTDLSGVWIDRVHGRLLLCMQSSGTGNCINALALPAATGTPCLMLVTMRGEAGETNPWQVPMGRAVRPVLEAMKVACFEARTSDQVGVLFEQAATLAFGEGRAAAVLIEQGVLGVKRFNE